MAWYIFLKQCDSVLEGGKLPAGKQLPAGSDSSSFSTVLPPPHHYGGKATGGHCSSSPPILETEKLKLWSSSSCAGSPSLILTGA